MLIDNNGIFILLPVMTFISLTAGNNRLFASLVLLIFIWQLCMKLLKSSSKKIRFSFLPVLCSGIFCGDRLLSFIYRSQNKSEFLEIMYSGIFTWFLFQITQSMMKKNQKIAGTLMAVIFVICGIFCLIKIAALF